MSLTQRTTSGYIANFEQDPSDHSKILQIIDYMDTNHLLHPNHHGFRAGHSTTTGLIQMYDKWVEAVDRGQYTGACFLDLSAAFDIVDHPLLLEKLKLKMLYTGSVAISVADHKLFTLRAFCPRFCQSQQVFLKDPYLVHYCTLSLPMSCLSLSMSMKPRTTSSII